MKTVLVVEDDADIRALIVRALKGRYRVMEACDGLVAAELLDSLAAEPPDLLVCDIMMPRVDGISLVTMLKKDARLQAMPVVFLTAKSGPDDVLRGINVGARHYLTKPFSMVKLLDKVNAALAAG